MRRTLAIAVLTCTAALPCALPSARAQMQPTVTPDTVPQGQASAKAAIARCGQLMALILSNPGTAGVTLEQARRWAAQQDVENCNDAAQRILTAAPGPTR